MRWEQTMEGMLFHCTKRACTWTRKLDSFHLPACFERWWEPGGNPQHAYKLHTNSKPELRIELRTWELWGFKAACCTTAVYLSWNNRNNNNKKKSITKAGVSNFNRISLGCPIGHDSMILFVLRKCLITLMLSGCSLGGSTTSKKIRWTA